MNELTNKNKVYISKLNGLQIFPCQYIHACPVSISKLFSKSCKNIIRFLYVLLYLRNNIKEALSTGPDKTLVAVSSSFVLGFLKSVLEFKQNHKTFSTTASKPMNIRWIRTIKRIVLYPVFYEYK